MIHAASQRAEVYAVQEYVYRRGYQCGGKGHQMDNQALNVPFWSLLTPTSGKRLLNPLTNRGLITCMVGLNPSKRCLTAGS